MLCLKDMHKKADLAESVLVHGSCCFNCECSSVHYSNSVKNLGRILILTRVVLENWHLWKWHRTLSVQLYGIKYTSVHLRQTMYRHLGESMLSCGISVYGLCASSRITKIDRLLCGISTNLLYDTAHEKSDKKTRMIKAGLSPLRLLHVQLAGIKNYLSKQFKKPNKKPVN